MTKYNPKNPQHRTWLAKRIIKVCMGYGLLLSFDVGEEYIFEKKVGEYTVRVYTSVDKRSGAVRFGGTDAIRVLCSNHANQWFLHRLRYNRNIHRRGTFDTIAKRLAESLRVANWNAENPDKPRWDGDAKPKRRQGGRIRKK
jgi:hypothetical protein